MRTLSKAMLCSKLAIATALVAGASPALAQGVNGTIVSSSGVDAPIVAGNTTTILLNSSRAIVNWEANGPRAGGVTEFQNMAQTLSFEGGGDFAVLNRVSPLFATDAISINGTINSLVNGATGGTVYFYSANGIIIGATGSINVGSLGLTTLPITDAGWTTAFGTGEIPLQFNPADNASSFIRVDGGGSITANGAGNYVALVAPRIEHRGTIRTDGVAALVAASAATVTFRTSGLYDIVVDAGSSDGNGVLVDGGTIERNSATLGGDRHAYLVSVPANNAMTMLVQGGASLGFDIAGSAAVEGNSVILSAGSDIIGGAVAGAPSASANVRIDHADITSNLMVQAGGSAQLVSSGGAISLSGDATIVANDINVIADLFALSVAGSLTASADVVGNGGVGGNIYLAGRNDQLLSILGDVVASANGSGASAPGDGLDGGSGVGGQLTLTALDGGALSIGGTLLASADGIGGQNGFTNGAGGIGTGGTVVVSAVGGGSLLTVGGSTTLTANGVGGSAEECTTCSVTGGDGIGGAVYVFAGTTGGGGGADALTFGDDVVINAEGQGGAGDAGSGEGTGGLTRLALAEAGTIDVIGTLNMSANGDGGFAIGTGFGGNGTGGTAEVQADEGGTLTLFSRAEMTANGRGGGTSQAAATAGNGQGGQVHLRATGTNSTIDARDAVLLSANGIGGTRCIECVGGAGGDGVGGQASVSTFGGNGNRVLVGTDLTIVADGTGGAGEGGAAGNGQGGGAHIYLADDGQVAVDGALAILARGTGGNHFNGGQAGDGTGGDAQVSLGGTSASLLSVGGGAAIDIDRSTTLDSSGTGGSAAQVAGGIGGDGTGGWSRVYGTAGQADFTGDVTIRAEGEGGAGQLGAGGAGTGGRARLNADGASYHLFAGLTLDTDARGGAGSTGGAALMYNLDGDNNAGLFANNGGSVVVDGATFMTASASGGAGSSGGAGGSATAGRTNVNAGDSAVGAGSINLASLAISADAVGGNGGNGLLGQAGGNGGLARAGTVVVSANNNAAVSSSIVIGDATLSAIGTGGSGGTGGAGPTGLAGGAGGNGIGGLVLAYSRGGASVLSIGALDADVSASGGVGGAGGVGDTGTGGTGGAGGIGDARFAEFGVFDGMAAPALGGGTSIATLAVEAVSLGGAGGAGGAGAGGSGAGGNGGSTGSAFVYVTAIGGSVTIGDLTVNADAIGGNGGGGSTSGIGGDAETSNIAIVALSSSANDAWRGNMSLGNVSGQSIAVGGIGSVAGQGIALGGAIFYAIDSDLDLASYAVSIVGADQISVDSISDPFLLINSNVAIAGAFDLATDNRLSVYNDGSSFSAASLSLDAADFARNTDFAAPVAFGNMSADTISLVSGLDLILDTNLVSLAALSLTAAGSVEVGDLTSLGAFVDIGAAGDIVTGTLTGDTVTLAAGGDITTGGITALLGGIDVAAGGSIVTGAIDAVDSVLLEAAGGITTGGITSLNGSIGAFAGGDILTGDLLAGGGILFESGGSIGNGSIFADWVELYALGDIAFQDAETSEYFDAEADGAIAAGDIVAGQSIYLAAAGAVTAGTLEAGLSNSNVVLGADYNIGVLSATSIGVGEASARDWIGFGTFGALTTGDLAAGSDVLLAADGNIATGAILTGAGDRLVVGGSDMAFIGGSFDDNYDRGLVFAAVDNGGLIASGGSVQIGGAIDTSRADVAAAGNITLAAIDAANGALFDAGGVLTLGGNASGDLMLIGSDIVVSEGVTIASAQLVSRNAAGTFVGDGLSGTDGYRLSNAEYGRFGSVLVAADLALGAGSTMTIGDLSIAAGNRDHEFIVGNSTTGAPGGVIRVVGDVAFTGALNVSGTGDGTRVGFTAGRFELDSSTGSLSLLDAQGNVAGYLGIAATDVWVAETAILDRLALDVNYAGRDEDLAAAPATQHPDGVVRAGEIYIDLQAGGATGGVTTAATPSFSVLVQNVGTSALPAGFTANYAEIISPAGAAPGAIDLVVNGQLVTPQGTLTGVAVRDALLADDDPARFAPSSRINGCALTGPCVLAEAPLPPVDPHPGIAAEIQLFAAARADELVFGNEESIEDNEEDGGEDSESSPIAPPDPLFDTGPLQPASDTDEPVSGGGNPALIGNGPVKGE